MAANLDAPFFVAASGHSRHEGAPARQDHQHLLAGERNQAARISFPMRRARAACRCSPARSRSSSRRHNVQVNGIAPGFFKTDMNAALIADAEFSAWVARRTPAGRWGEPPEIAGAAVFLASDAGGLRDRPRPVRRRRLQRRRISFHIRCWAAARRRFADSEKPAAAV